MIGAVFSLFWTAFIWVVGGWDSQIQALCCLAIADYVTGVFAACKTHSFASDIAAHGIGKKGVMFLIVGIGAAIDYCFAAHMVRTMFIGCFAMIESMSIIENIDRAGYGDFIPAQIRNCLAQVSQREQMPMVPQQNPTLRH
jgi:toxin secretion/phage lysis holin